MWACPSSAALTLTPKTRRIGKGKVREGGGNMFGFIVRAGAIALIAASATVFAVQPAGAAYPAGVVGHDVSYPQCSSSGSTSTTVGGLGGSFGIVGVTGGRPFGANSCSAAELAWASGLPQPPGLYMNTANPAPTSSYYWPTSGTSDPALCQNSASTTDPGCAYDYGWHAAADALTKEAAGLSGAPTLAWWLDVETANSWNGNGTSNAADLQGATDYLRSHGVPSVGIYSTGSQWSTITGGYSSATAASYASAWAPEFTAQYPMTGSPVWVAGLGDASTANSNCSSGGFSGGQVWLAQYNDGSGYDADLSCQTGGNLSIGPGPVTLTAGTPSSALDVALSTPAPAAGLAVTVSSSSTAGSFSTSSSGPFSAGPLHLTVTGGGTTSPTFFYEDTKAGNPVLTATSPGWASGNQTDTVNPATLQTITVAASSSTVTSQSTDSLTATGADAYGNVVAVNPTWASSLGGTFSPNPGPSTTYTAPSGSGTDTITASQGQVAGQTTVTVTTAPPPAPTLVVKVTGGTSSTNHNRISVPFSVSVTGPSGSGIGGAAVSWKALPGACPSTGGSVASGSGTTSSSGTYSSKFSVRSPGSYCVVANASGSGYTSGSGSATVTA